MIHEVGNIELFELLETEPKTQCKVCLSYWDIDVASQPVSFPPHPVLCGMLSRSLGC